MVYDRSDRLIWSQDAVQRENGKWTYYKYDRLGRMILSGVKSNSSSRIALESQYKSMFIVEEVQGSSNLDYSTYYTNSSGLLAQSNELLQVNWFEQ
jgi:hypothetical protein